MSASRTLLRKLKVTRDRLASSKRIKRGTRNRSVIYETKFGGVYEYSFHATKGARLVRITYA